MKRPFTPMYILLLHTYLVVMYSSWNFLSWAESSKKGSESSQAWALHIPRWNQAVDMYVNKNIFVDQNCFFLILLTSDLENQSFQGEYIFATEKNENSNEYYSAEPSQRSQAEASRAEPSRAEPKILQLKLWLEPDRLGLITNI